MSVDTRSIVCRYIGRGVCRPILVLVHRYFTDTLPTLHRHFADTLPILHRQSVATSVDSRSTLDRASVKSLLAYRPSIDLLSTDISTESGKKSGKKSRKKSTKKWGKKSRKKSEKKSRKKSRKKSGKIKIDWKFSMALTGLRNRWPISARCTSSRDHALRQKQTTKRQEMRLIFKLGNSLPREWNLDF